MMNSSSLVNSPRKVLSIAAFNLEKNFRRETPYIWILMKKFPTEILNNALFVTSIGFNGSDYKNPAAGRILEIRIFMKDCEIYFFERLLNLYI